VAGGARSRRRLHPQARRPLAKTRPTQRARREVTGSFSLRRLCRGAALERYRISERCAEFTEEILDFWVKVLRNEPVLVMVNGKPATWALLLGFCGLGFMTYGRWKEIATSAMG
jgi:hypothetical protein